MLCRPGRDDCPFHLKRLTLRRWLGPDASADELRHLEGQRHLVSLILALASAD